MKNGNHRRDFKKYCTALEGVRKPIIPDASPCPREGGAERAE